jgi:bacterioferritin
MSTQLDNNKKTLSSVEELRRKARQQVEEGAVTEGYDADRKQILKMLNEALATELVCVLRYRRHYFMAKGLES